MTKPTMTVKETNHRAARDLALLLDPQRLETLQNLNYTHLFYFWIVAREGSIAAACQRLQLTQPTISMQIRKLEKSLGHRLFERSGRNLTLSGIGQIVYEYSDDIFSLGRELLGTLRGEPGGRISRLQVGVSNCLPKLVSWRLLEPVLQMPQTMQIVCHEANLPELIADLAVHKFDVILSDTPLGSGWGIRGFTHPLGDCGIAICGTRALAARSRGRFPHSLDGAPLLLPTSSTEMRRTLDRWFDAQGFRPRVVAEFDDSALMEEFGSGGAGLFPIPVAVLDEVRRQYNVELVGRLPNLRVHYYAITTERKLTHPATVIIAQTAKTGLLDEPDE